jgi:hypothetical protein
MALRTRLQEVIPMKSKAYRATDVNWVDAGRVGQGHPGQTLGGLDQPPPQDPLRRDPFRWAHWPGMMAGWRWGLTGAEFRNGFPPEKPPTIRRGHRLLFGTVHPGFRQVTFRTICIRSVLTRLPQQTSAD